MSFLAVWFLTCDVMNGASPWRGFDFENVVKGRRRKRSIIEELIRALREFPFYPGFRTSNGRWRPVNKKALKVVLPGRRRDRKSDVLLLVKKALDCFGLQERSNIGLYCTEVAQAWRRSFRSRRRLDKKLKWRRKYSNPVKVGGKAYQKLLYKVDKRLKKGCSWSISQWTRWHQRFWIKYKHWVPRNVEEVRKLIKSRKAKLCARDGIVAKDGGRVEETSTMRLVSCNITSATHLPELIDSYWNQADVFLVQETNSGDSTWPGVGGWRLLNFPRVGRRGGGTGIVYRESIGRVSVLPGLKYRDGDDGIEWLWARVPCGYGAVYVCSVYAPPMMVCTQMIQATFRNHLKYVRTRSDFVGAFVGGDLNCSLFGKQILMNKKFGGLSENYLQRGRRWLTFLERDLNGRMLNNLDISATNHSVINNGVATIVDYSFWFGDPKFVKSFAVTDGVLQHNALKSVLSIPMTMRLKKRRVNFQRLGRKRYLTQFQSKLSTAKLDADCDIGEWYSTIRSIGGETLGFSSDRVLRPGKPWWSEELDSDSKKLRSLRRLRRKLIRQKLPFGHVHAQLLAGRKLFSKKLRTAKREYWRSLRRCWDTSSMKMREAFQFVKRVRKRSGRPQMVHTRKEMEDAWGPILGTEPPLTCMESRDRKFLERVDWDDMDTTEAMVTMEELKDVIRTLPSRKAPGYDGISNLVLKSLTDEFLHPLVNLFNTVLEDPSEIPSLWFKSNVFLIPKADNPGPLQYRPITLLSCVAKLLEKILWERVKSWNVPLRFNQGGFVTDRGCIEQVWRLVTVDQCLRLQKRSGMTLLLDLKKAYDRVPFAVLVRKLMKKNEIKPYFVRFVKFWLEGHERYLLVDEAEATPLPVRCGVPQGSILSPFLFNVFIDDLILKLERLPSGIELSPDGAARSMLFSTFGYADDIAQVALVPDQADDLFRTALAVASGWEMDNGMEFGPLKCLLLALGKVKKNRSLSVMINGTVVEESKEAEYLGVKMRAGGRRTLDNSRGISAAKAFFNTRFTMLESAEGCSLLVGTIIAHSIYVPKLLYGCEVYKPSLKPGQQALNALYRKILNCFDSDSATKYRRFLGCRPFEELVMARVVRFALKLATCRFHTLREWFLNIIDVKLPWCVYVRKQFRLARSKFYLEGDVPRRHSDAFRTYFADYKGCCDRLVLFNHCWEEYKPRAHGSVYHAQHRARFVYIFFRGHLNPNNSDIKDGVLNCFLCGARKQDCVKHYVNDCERIQPYLSDIADTRGLPLHQVRYLMNHVAEASSWEWKESDHVLVAEACMRIWKARVVEWRKWNTNGRPIHDSGGDLSGSSSWESDDDALI